MMIQTAPIERQDDSFAALVKSVEGTTSLVTLAAIEKTVEALAGFSQSFLGLAEQASVLTDDICRTKAVAGAYLDEDGTRVARLEASRQRVVSTIEEFDSKKAAIDHDPELKQHHCELLHDSYADCIQKANQMVDSLAQLVAAVEKHNYIARLTLLKQNTDEASVANFEKIQQSGSVTVESLSLALARRRAR